MKTLLTLLLLIPSLSWGSEMDLSCELKTAFISNKPTDISTNPPTLFNYKINKMENFISTNKPNVKKILIKESNDSEVEFTENTERGNSTWRIDLKNFQIYGGFNDYFFSGKCQKIAEINLNSNNTSEIIDKCINLGFNKGTEGLKNCVLELSK